MKRKKEKTCKSECCFCPLRDFASLHSLTFQLERRLCPADTCTACGKTGRWSHCTRCYQACYCSPDCQVCFAANALFLSMINTIIFTYNIKYLTFTFARSPTFSPLAATYCTESGLDGAQEGMPPTGGHCLFPAVVRLHSKRLHL